MSDLNILLYKWIYILVLIPFLIYRFKDFRYIDLKNSFKIKSLSKEFKILCIFLIIFATFCYLTWIPFPKAHTDVVFHSYKIKHIMEEKTIYFNGKYFYENSYYEFMYSYPSGFHLFIYVVTNKVENILKNIAYFRIIFLVLMGLAYYYLGSVFDKKIGLFMSVFGIISPVFIVQINLLETIPNIFGYYFFLISVALSILYIKIKNRKYLILLFCGLVSMAFTHIFPLLMYILFLVSMFLSYGLIKHSLNVFITFIISMVYSYSISFHNSKIQKAISEVSSSLCIDNKPWNIYVYYIINALANIPYNFNVLNNNYYILYNIYLLILGILQMIRRYSIAGMSLVMTLILSLLWMVNVKIGLYIPFFTRMYRLERAIDNFLVLIPIFYAFGAMYIYELKNKHLKVILGIFTIMSIYLTFTSSYAILEHSESCYIFVSKDDFNTFNWIDNNNITNETFMGQFIYNRHRFFLALDGVQYIPLYTQNKILFCYTNYKFYIHHYYNVRNWIYSYNYSAFLNFSKTYNTSYIYYSDNYPNSYKFNKNFFENETYFQKVYENGTITLYKVK